VVAPVSRSSRSLDRSLAELDGMVGLQSVKAEIRKLIAGGPIALTDIHSQGVRYAGPVGVEIQGWLRARKAGRYQIGADLNAHFGRYGPMPPTCFLQAWLEGRSLDRRSILVSRPGSNDGNASLVLGAELQPSLYKLHAWMTCTSPLNVTTTAELLLKSPSEMNLRPIAGGDLLYQEE
jgi:hypothetical protein